MAVIYSEPLVRKYVAPRMSLAWAFKVFVIAAMVILPYLFAWWTHSMWKKTETYREQPDVDFTRKLLVVLETGTPGQPIVYSTIPEANEVTDPALLRVPTVDAVHIDVDQDQVADYFNLTLLMPLRTGESVYRAHLAMFFKFSLRSQVRLVMDTLLYASESSPLPGGELVMLGDMMLRQVGPLPPQGDRVVYQSAILNPASIRSVSDVLLPTILSTSFRRNETTVFDRAHTHWGTGQPSEFRIHAHVRIPAQTIEYVPEFWEVLKFGWIQYLAILFVVHYFLDLLRWFVHRYQLVDTRLVGPVEPSAKPHLL